MLKKNYKGTIDENDVFKVKSARFKKNKIV